MKNNLATITTNSSNEVLLSSFSVSSKATVLNSIFNDNYTEFNNDLSSCSKKTISIIETDTDYEG